MDSYTSNDLNELSMTGVGSLLGATEEDINALEVRVSSNESNITTLQSGLATEVNNRTNADIALQGDIDAEALARVNADNALQANIVAEALARVNADNALQNNINAEALARVNADNALQANIVAEAQARIDGDALKVNKSGDTMAGDLTVSNPNEIYYKGETLDARFHSLDNDYYTEAESDARFVNVEGLQTILDGKQPTIGNDHLDIAHVEGLQSALDTHTSDIASNTAKTGITTAQANAIIANTAKTGITQSQANAITANTAKTGITSQQTADILTNNAKTGISTNQANAIIANTAKTGITQSQANAITANTAKTGITSQQTADILTNNAKTGISTNQANAIVANTAKVGITTAQANAIVANTAKVGITTAQANAIVANTAKVGITTAQANNITNSVKKTGESSQNIDGQLQISGNGGAVLDLIGTNHAYMEFYPDGVSAGRKAYMGYGSSATETFTIANQFSNSQVSISPNLTVDGSTTITSTLNANSNLKLGSNFEFDYSSFNGTSRNAMDGYSSFIALNRLGHYTNGVKVFGNLNVDGDLEADAFLIKPTSSSSTDFRFIHPDTSELRIQQPHHIDAYSHGTSGTSGRTLYLQYYSNSDVRVGNGGGHLYVNNNLICSGTYQVGTTPLLHIAVPFRASVANSTTITDAHFFANYITKYSIGGKTVSGAFDENKLRAYKHPTAWYIHSVSIMYDDDNSTNGVSLYLATNLNSKGQGTPLYGVYNLGSKLSGDLCSTYTFSSPILVGINNSIRCRTQYSSSSANETSFVLHGYQA